MPILIFNKDIFEETTQGKKKIEDVTSHTLNHQGYIGIKIINIRVGTGVERFNEILLNINDKPLSLSEHKHKFLIDLFQIDKEFQFNKKDMSIRIDVNFSFSLSLNYEYYK
jgi:hypothetical protein